VDSDDLEDESEQAESDIKCLRQYLEESVGSITSFGQEVVAQQHQK
jgi:hypothetical protein